MLDEGWQSCVALDDVAGEGRFSTAYPEIEAAVGKLDRRLPAESAKHGHDFHSTLMGILRNLAEIADGGQDAPEPLQTTVRHHVRYHAALVAPLVPVPLSEWERHLPIGGLGPDERDQIRRSVGELVQHVAAALDEATDLAAPDPAEMLCRLDDERCIVLREAGVWLIASEHSFFPSCVFEPVCASGSRLAGFRGSLGAFSYSHSRLNGNIAEIGRYCSIASDVLFGEAEHPLDWVTTSNFTHEQGFIFGGFARSVGRTFPKLDLPGSARRDPIVIGHDVWIGARCVIRGGVRIGTGAVIGAQSVVTRDVEPYTVVAGSPARVIRRRFPDAIVERLLRSEWWSYAFTDFSDMDVRDPAAFLDALEGRIADGSLTPYRPPLITGSELARLMSADDPAPDTLS